MCLGYINTITVSCLQYLSITVQRLFIHNIFDDKLLIELLQIESLTQQNLVNN